MRPVAGLAEQNEPCIADLLQQPVIVGLLVLQRMRINAHRLDGRAFTDG
jgi:hypothetical protein